MDFRKVYKRKKKQSMVEELVERSKSEAYDTVSTEKQKVLI